MKTLQKCLILACAFVLFSSISYAQNDNPTMFNVHQDNVNFDKIPLYESTSKEFIDQLKKHNIQEYSATTISMDDGRYVHVSPISSMSDLDKNLFKGLVDKMGKEAFGAMMDKFDECYDSHSDYIVHHYPDLSYNPAGVSNEGMNYREYHFMYFAPKNEKSITEALKNIKTLFTNKGSKVAYNIYRSGFGNSESFFMVSIAAKDELDLAQKGKANDNLLGDERKSVFFNMIKNVSHYVRSVGDIRPDLSYIPTNKQ